MPVVEKIESIGQTTTVIGNKYCSIIPRIYNKTFDAMESFKSINGIGKTKIGVTYSAILQFITWYNSRLNNTLKN